VRYFWLAMMAVVLPSCTHLKDDQAAVNRQLQDDSRSVGSNIRNSSIIMATTVRDNFRKSGEKLHAWLIEPPAAEKPSKPIKASYCYHVLQDILCYRAPVPGWEYRLAGYQGTGAEPPPPAMMEAPPLTEATKQKLPSNRIATAAPVFSEVPTPLETKKDEIDLQNPGSVDPTHESLPNPALAPQL
jgi:hypothetical protein